ncbi:glutamate transporter polyphemus-like [Drosophila biarmipes]|uniref:glutamate transporter polyphemus-like n=1 Tax=Drosophila biarmipes TaxID=125945 RepID=UPI0007E7E8A0|nr:glutamate transporter polyphemus-like [Drosophila biarmipes]
MTDTAYDPYANRNVDKPISNFGAFVSVIKCVVGTGVLALPMAFKYAGTILGPLLLIATAFVLIHGIQMLIMCMVECSRRAQVGYTNFPDSMAYSFAQGPKCFRYIATAAGYVADITLCIAHYGICVVYLVFVSSNFSNVLERYIDIGDLRYYIAIFGLLSVPFFCIIHLKYLVPLNIIANILIYIGFAMIFYYIFQDLQPFSDLSFFGDPMRLPQFFGIVLFSISSVGVFIAVESKMAHPQKFIGWFGVLDIAAIVVVISYIIFGIFGYWRYGDGIAASLTLNLPEEPLSLAIQIILATDIFLTFPLSGYVVINIIMTHFWNKRGDLKRAVLKEIILRIGFVVLATLNGVAFPDLGPLLALVGALTLSLLNLVFPAFMEICLNYPEGYSYGRYKWKLVKDIVMITFGVLILVQGTIFSIIDMVVYYGHM